MYKKIVITLIGSLVAAITLSAQQVKPLKLSGSVNGIDQDKIYLEQYDNKVFRTIDSAVIDNGAFRFETLVTLPELYGLRLKDESYPIQIFLEDNPIEVELHMVNGQIISHISGSKAHNYFEQFRESQRKVTAKEFILADPESIVAAFVLFRNYSYDFTPDEIQEHIALLSPKLLETQYVRILSDLVEKQRAVLPGNKVIDFISFDPEGNEIRFSDHLGQGYVLLDFWAAWCGPCRRENPNIVAAYKTYKSRGFSVFGVSLDKDKDSWINAIKNDDLEWTQVSDLAFWDTEAAALYGVRFIPSNLLIDPQGIIVARNIKGDDLHQILEKLYNTQ